MCLLLSLTKPGDTVLTDRLTYPGIKSAAAAAGVRLVGVEADAGRHDPGGARRGLQAAQAQGGLSHSDHPQSDDAHDSDGAARAARRRDPQARPAAVRGRRLWRLDPKLAPIATLDPERSYLVATLSKCIAPGLRVSFMVTPDRAAAALLGNTLRTVAQMPVPLMVALALRWLADGSADAIIAAITAEAAARQKLAAKALAGHDYAAHPRAIMSGCACRPPGPVLEFAAHVQRQGLAVVTSDSFSCRRRARARDPHRAWAPRAAGPISRAHSMS